MVTKLDEEILFSPLHAIFVFSLIGFAALALLFTFIFFFTMAP